MRNFFRFLAVIWFLVFTSAAWAGGALKTNINGLPFVWGQSLVYNPENGVLKSGVYDKAASLELIAEAFSKWDSIPGVDLQIVKGEFLPDGGDVTRSNYKQFYDGGISECYDNNPNTPCYNPIIFDEDGSILEDMFGECAQFSLLGFAGFRDVAGNSSDPSLTVLKRGQAIFSGACIAPAISKKGCPPCVQVLDDKAVRSMILHELGHMMGMDHSQVNPDSYLACEKGGNCTKELSENIPTMFPLLVRGADQLNLHQDDIAQFRRLYSKDPQEGYCSVSGNVYSPDGVTPLRGVEIVARNTNPDLNFTDAISFVSGAEAPRITAKDKTQGNCLEGCGEYKITGLTPGETYQICHQRILSDFTGTRAINPVEVPFQGVDNACPEGLRVTCQCPTGHDCPEYKGVNVTTTNTGLDSSVSNLVATGFPAGGCSLFKPLSAHVYLWSQMMRVLRPWIFG